jgi:hypothetical protein
MKLARRLFLPVLAAISLWSCSNGDECKTCNQDSDCKTGFVCSTFSDGSKRCGTGTGATSCRVRN